jgi:RND family efflux transporter MFP subunit
VPVTVAAADQRTVPIRLQAIGNVEAYQTVSIKARVDGQIVEVKFREGQPVTRGELLFRIDPRPYEAALRQAEANALRDSAARDQARSQAKRYQELLDKNFISKEAYAQIRTNAETAEATAKASRAALENARLNLEYCSISSPLDGYVGKVLLQGRQSREGERCRAARRSSTRCADLRQLRGARASLPGAQVHGERAARGRVVRPMPGREVARRLHHLRQRGRPSTARIRLRREFETPKRALARPVRQRQRALYEQPTRSPFPRPHGADGPEGQYVYRRETSPPSCASRWRDDGESRSSSGLQKRAVVTRGQLRLGRRAGADRQASGGGPEFLRAVRAPAGHDGAGDGGILIFGLAAYRLLPVSTLPNVDFPTIQVTARAAGASPETMASAVATVLEKQFSTIAGIDEMSSVSGQGITRITIQFASTATSTPRRRT